MDELCFMTIVILVLCVGLNIICNDLVCKLFSKYNLLQKDHISPNRETIFSGISQHIINFQSVARQRY